MSSSERYRRLAEAFDSTVSAVPAQAWDNPSPCEEWSAREVLAHVLDSEADVVGNVDLTVPRSVDVADDPVAAWREVRDAVQAILDDPATATLTYESLGEQTTIAESVDRFLCFDLVVHRWDIAVATGSEVTLPDEDVEACHAFLDAMGSMFYDYGASKPALAVADDASPQDKLLARAGRDPRWRP